MLTAREREVLQSLLAGQSNKEIAQALGISLRTVEMHRGNMMDRLGASSLAEALTWRWRPASSRRPTKSR